MKLKLISMLIIAGLVTVPSVVGQQADSGNEMSIEESYLQEAVEMMIIRETSRSDSRDQKFIALEYIGNAIERGNTGDEIRTTLEYLSLEGTQNRATENKRLVNDYPDVRMRAARYLGLVGNEEAKNVLKKICAVESEPMVLQEAIKSLGMVEASNIDDAVEAIVWVVNKHDRSTAPDSLLALAAVDTLDKIARKNNGLKSPNAFMLLTKIKEGPYVPAVKERARRVIDGLRRYTAQGQQQQQK